MTHPLPHPADRPVRVLFVFACLTAGDEANDVLHLAHSLDRARYRFDVLACAGSAALPDATRLEAFGIHVDRTAHDLSFTDTVQYLERKIAGHDIIVSYQDVADIYPALERLDHHPPLIERGMIVAEALSGPKHFTSRYVGASDAVCAAAASRMPARPHHARTIAPMVDIAALDPSARSAARASLGLRRDALVIGEAGSPGFTALVRACQPGASVLMPWAPGATGTRTGALGPLCGLDIFVWGQPGEGTPLAILRAGAAGVAVVATDGGVPDWFRDGETGLVVPDGDLAAMAAAIDRLACDPGLRLRLGTGLRAHVAATHACAIVARQWEAVFEEVLAETAAPPPGLFRSFMQGGFEASTHRLGTGRRLDMIAATGHDAHPESDYRQLGAMGISTIRDAARWHLIEREPGRHDFSSFLPMARAARRAGVEVIWDLLHYGWPDDIDIWSPAFVNRFAAYARSIARVWRDTTDEVPFWCPVNEISFFAWAGGDARYLNPFAAGRGFELKVQLARASIAAMHTLRDVDPRARFVHCEPLIAVHHDPATGRPRPEAEGWHQAQFQAFELLMGRLWPQIGGEPSLLDIIGVNYYPNNQWIHAGPPIDVDHPSYRPLSDLLFEIYARYRRPVFISETGVEEQRRAPWLRYVSAEVARARRRGVPVEGVCLYPVLNHPGWDDDRACHNGLLA